MAALSPSGTRRLHVLGGGPWQLPTIHRAKSLGLHVLVTDYYADRPAYAVADAHEVVDITDVAATLEVARHHRIDGILCDSTDTGVPTAARVAEALGLPGIGAAAAEVCTNKALLHARCLQRGLAAPAHAIVRDAGELDAATGALQGPLVFKPVDNQSGRGVSIAVDRAARRAACALAMSMSRRHEVLVQERLDGPEYIVDSFVDTSGVQVLGIAEKTPYADNPTISRRIGYLGGAAYEHAHAALAAANVALMEAAGLHRGIAHAEFIVDRRLGPVAIDLAARGGGVMIYSHVLPHVSGVDAVEASIRAALDQPVRVAPSCRRAACIEFLRLPPGTLEAWRGHDAALRVSGVAAVHLAAQPGEAVGELARKDDRAGFIVALAADLSHAVASACRAKSMLRARLTGVDAEIGLGDSSG